MTEHDLKRCIECVVRTIVLVAGVLLFDGPASPSSGSDRTSRTTTASGAMETLPSPLAWLRQSTDELRRLLQRSYPSWSPEAEMQRSSVRRLVDDAIDYREFGRRALGAHWARISTPDRLAFLDVLRRLFEQRYYLHYLHGTRQQIHFEREEVVDGDASVFAKVASTRHGAEATLTVEYRLLFKNHHWAVFDIVTDRESLLEDYRGQFDRIIARESFKGLLERLRSELGDEVR